MEPHPEPIPFTSQWTYELTFPCDPRSPGIVRTTVRSVLAAHGLTALSSNAELLASELVTNSVRHTKGPAGIRLHWLFPVLRGSVWDPAPDLPTAVLNDPVPAPPTDADDGRGLFLLDALADRWGGCSLGSGSPFGGGGKSLWFELCCPAVLVA